MIDNKKKGITIYKIALLAFILISSICFEWVTLSFLKGKIPDSDIELLSYGILSYLFIGLIIILIVIYNPKNRFVTMLISLDEQTTTQKIRNALNISKIEYTINQKPAKNPLFGTITNIGLFQGNLYIDIGQIREKETRIFIHSSALIESSDIELIKNLLEETLKSVIITRV